MIQPLGPRGSVGISSPMKTPSLEILELLIEYRKSTDKPIRYSETCKRVWEAAK